MRAHKFETEQQLEPELELELNNCEKICYTFLQPHNKCQLPLPPDLLNGVTFHLPLLRIF